MSRKSFLGVCLELLNKYVVCLVLWYFYGNWEKWWRSRWNWKYMMWVVLIYIVLFFIWYSWNGLGSVCLVNNLGIFGSNCMFRFINLILSVWFVDVVVCEWKFLVLILCILIFILGESKKLVYMKCCF